MYLPRNVDAVLDAWFHDPARKPLVLRGARQTGKSTSVRELGKRATSFVEVNLDRFEDQRLVRAAGSLSEFLDALCLRANLPALPEGTLLFIDEIQQEPQIIPWLRYLHEDHPGIAVVAAGSLLEVRMTDRGFQFPVGRVTFRTLGPLTFLEFLRATGKDLLAGRLLEHLRDGIPVLPAVHGQATALLGDYLFVGGMPEAVAHWCREPSLVGVRQVHRDLLQALAEDIQKYRGNVAAVEAAFEALPHHYGMRFKYEQFAPGHRSRDMHAAIDRLEAARLVLRALPTGSVDLPASPKERAAPKLVPLDIGIAMTQWGLGPNDLKRTGPDRMLEGRVAEAYVGQQLACPADCQPADLWFWVRDQPGSDAEVDYLLPQGRHLVPVEVKAGAAGRLKSLHRFLWTTGKKVGLRLHAGNLSDERHVVQMPDGELHHRLLSIPLYLAAALRERTWE
jgi:predicted AAA+ superfamily ATPase